MNIEELPIFKSIMETYRLNKDKVSDSLGKLQNILASESQEVTEMLEIYRRYLAGEDIDKDTMDNANNQFRELLKSVGILGIFALPGGLVAITFLVKLGNKLNIDILPKSFKK